MSRALTPITTLASEFCADIGDSHEDHHFRFMQKLLRAYKMLHMYISPELDVMSEIFPVTSQIELPCHFVYETKIGLLRNNVLVTLDLDRNLRLSNARFNDTQMTQQINGLFDGSIDPGLYYPFFNCCRGGNFLGELYGIGCGWHSNTWYNIKDGVLELSSIIPDDGQTEIVVEFKSNGLKDGFKLIPDEMVEAANYKAKELFYEDTKPGLSDKMAEKYKVEYQRLKRLYSYRPPEYLAWLFKSTDRPAHY